MGLHENETRKQAFGAYAGEYDAVRPRYPAALFDRVAAHARLTAATRALEIGSGTGIATLPFAEVGMSVLCLELSEAMAAVARRKLVRFPRVTVETTRFEDWAGPAGAFDLVYCAQAWHWLPPTTREPLLADIAAAIEEAGGSVTRRHEAMLMLARPAK